MRYLLAVSLFIIATVIPLSNASAQYGERIDSFDVDIQVNLDGTIGVSERIGYDFGTYERRGIFRVIPFVKTNTDGDDYEMDFKVLSVRDDKGKDQMFTVSRNGKDIEIKIGDPNVTVTGKNTYIINYIVSGALTYFSEHDELYWNITGDEWEVPIDSVSARISLPADVPTETLTAVCYTGFEGSTAENCNINTSGNTVSVTAQNLSSREGLTVSTGFAPGIITELEPERYYPIHPFLIAILIFLAFLYFLALPFYLLVILLKDMRFVKQNAKVVTAWFDPPKNDDLSWYTPEETAFLVDNNAKTEHVTAKIVWLAQQGYLKINVDEKDKVSFVLTEKPYMDLGSEDISLLTSLQKAGSENTGLLKAIIGQNEEQKQTIELAELKNSTQFGTTVTDIKTKLQKRLEDKQLYSSKIWRNKGLVMFFAMMGLFTLNLLLVAVMFLFYKRFKGFSAKGLEKYAEAQSLKNFLVSQDEKLDFQAENQMYFEKLLPYATAFGVEDVWIKRFEHLNVNMPDWYNNRSGVYAFNSVTSGINSSVTGAVRTSTRSSSGFSSGGSGGSSGGGGGGGGGGSW